VRLTLIRGYDSDSDNLNRTLVVLTGEGFPNGAERRGERHSLSAVSNSGWFSDRFIEDYMIQLKRKEI